MGHFGKNSSYSPYDKGLTLETSAYKPFTVAKFTLSTQLLRLNYLNISLNDKVEAFLVENLPWEV